ncbi:MAG: DNA-directed RNA polymerase subunit beta' [Brevinemataceae bacterium]
MKGMQGFGSISVNLASSDLIRSLSHGEVLKPETINYRTLRAEKDGLFCERIFGPTKDYECSCGKFRSIRYKGIICDRCGVEVTESKVRRYRTGHIELVAPVAHIWYYRIIPSKIAILLDVAPSSIQSILYFEKYIVIDPGETDLAANQVLSDEEYDEYRDRYKEAFTAGSGAGAVRQILRNLDLDSLADELRAANEYQNKSDKKVIKRLELVEELRKSKNKPEWIILDAVPVVPPDLRPMVPLDGGRFATSDINDLYRRLINRNNRLKKLKSVNAPDIIIKNEMRMVQDAADSLFDNSRRAHPVTGGGDRPLKSLSDILKGKQGRFRQNLLGKRVDYSGRSVIIVGPNLKLHQCGLPKQMALELFKPFVMRGLVEREFVSNIKAAKHLIEVEHERVWEVLEDVVRDHPVLLNRAPTLHRLGIQAFEPILVEEKAIQLHPLVCHAYNADFDGDQMAVHVPISSEAQIEAWLLMLSSRNLLNPANGHPVVYPTQDMVLGIYYLTKPKLHKPEKLKKFDSYAELIFTVDNRILGYEDWILYKMDDEWVETTIGRVIFNQVIPEKLGFINDTLNSKRVEKTIADCYKIYGIKETAYLVDDLKNMGYSHATKVGVTISISDVKIPQEKYEIVAKTEKEVQKIEDNARRGLITYEEKYNQVIDLWASANERIKKLVETRLRESDDGFNALYVMMDSGARGSREQIRQLSGMRGLMAKPSGEILEMAIRSNFKEGLSVLEYFISSHGARKGLADTALKTADAGYLTRKLVDIAQDVVIIEHDCGTLRYMELEAVRQGEEIIKTLSERCLGRVSAVDIFDPRNGDLIVSANEIIDEEAVQKIEEADIDKIRIRSVLTCEAEQGVCSKCYGWDLSQLQKVNIGEAVGIIAAESIGQPGTQLTMRTFHIGGTAATSLEENQLSLSYDAYVLNIPENIVSRQGELGEERLVTRKGAVEVQKILVQIPVDTLQDPSEADRLDGMDVAAERTVAYLNTGEELRFGRRVIIRKIHDMLLALEYQRYSYPVRVGSNLKIHAHSIINRGTTITEFDPYNELYVCEYNGFVRYAEQVVDGETEKDKSILLITDEEGKELERFMIISGVSLAVEEGSYVKAGDTIARRPMAKRRTKDIIGGLPRVTELFESRQPKNVAVVALCAGLVENINLKKGKYTIVVRTNSGRIFNHVVVSGKNIYVRIGDRVEAGEPLCDGIVSPHDILRVLGQNAVEQFLLEEIQAVYRLQGVEINEKHISIIIRQMLRKVEIIDPADTEFITGQIIDRQIFQKENNNVVSQGGQAAKARPILMGLTKVALVTESFLSAASFQETPKVLSGAALRGAVDHLQGLKENLVIGQLIPAGTGIKHYESLKIIGKRNL